MFFPEFPKVPVALGANAAVLKYCAIRLPCGLPVSRAMLPPV